MLLFVLDINIYFKNSFSFGHRQHMEGGIHPVRFNLFSHFYLIYRKFDTDIIRRHYHSLDDCGMQSGLISTVYTQVVGNYTMQVQSSTKVVDIARTYKNVFF
ncbi:unnamed protein product [Chrysodeixis includens]|uniref:Uncharacterized protein n=1 Tax=Chrysodeixis includens TaxID=689277 RepID=A0A9N8KZC9_CHRIL|nr:unnamed protein product [Chrysodeixis includens]